MFLTLRQAAKLFGMSLRSVQRRVATGEWPSVKLGPRIVRVDPDEVIKIGSLVEQIQCHKLGDQQNPGRDKSNRI